MKGTEPTRVHSTRPLTSRARGSRSQKITIIPERGVRSFCPFGDLSRHAFWMWMCPSCTAAFISPILGDIDMFPPPCTPTLGTSTFLVCSGLFLSLLYV